MLTSVLQESQGLTKNTFVMLLSAMISLHMLTFRLMVTTLNNYSGHSSTHEHDGPTPLGNVTTVRKHRGCVYIYCDVSRDLSCPV